jgi:hypothetical protein
LLAKLCALFAVGVAPRPALADSDALHKAATMVRADRTGTYRVESPKEGPGPRSFRVVSLPDFVTFDAETETFTLKPHVNRLGHHRAELEIRNGDGTEPFTLTITVVRNRPPMVVFDEPFLVANRQNRRRIQLIADEDADPLTIVSQRLPPGAIVYESEGGLHLDWGPNDSELGEHPLQLVVSDGLETVRLDQTVIVVPKNRAADWSTHLTPSLGATTLVSHSGDAFAGGVFEWTLFARRLSGDDGLNCRWQRYRGDCHPSLFRFYLNFELLDATSRNEPAVFTYAFGYSGALEAYAERDYLVPFYGLEVGGLWQDEDGQRFAVRPALGLHLWADHRFWVDVSLGERIVPTELSRLSGPSATLSAMLIPW